MTLLSLLLAVAGCAADAVPTSVAEESDPPSSPQASEGFELFWERDFTGYQSDEELFAAISVSTQNNVHAEPGVGMRYDFQPRRGRCGDQSLGARLDLPPGVTAVLLEFEGRFSANWTNENPNCSSPAPDYKHVLVWTELSDGDRRFDWKMGVQRSLLHASSPGVREYGDIPWRRGGSCEQWDGKVVQCRDARQYWDGQWHRYQLHFELHGDGTCTVRTWIDGRRIHDYREGCRPDATRLTRISWGANRNLGAVELMQLWWRWARVSVKRG